VREDREKETPHKRVVFVGWGLKQNSAEVGNDGPVHAHQAGGPEGGGPVQLRVNLRGKALDGRFENARQKAKHIVRGARRKNDLRAPLDHIEIIGKSVEEDIILR
jgi:hypothetical protein